jgi:hypothetical protein
MKKETDNHIGADIEDIEDVIKVIETSYDIKFEPNELGHLKTFGEMIDYIIGKIQLTDKEDCTSQQGFYKLRDAITKIRNLDRGEIAPGQKLMTLFPRQTRSSDLTEIEKELGFKLNGLRPRHFITITLVGLFLISTALFFVDWKYALSGILLAGILSWTSEKMGIEFKDKTIGELTERMTQRNYVQSRRNKKTINKREIEEKIKALFLEELFLLRRVSRLGDSDGNKLNRVLIGYLRLYLLADVCQPIKHKIELKRRF